MTVHAASPAPQAEALPPQAVASAPLGTVPHPGDSLLDDLALAQVAQYFKALSEPLRLKLIRLLRHHGALNVGEMTEYLGCSQPNVSKHLAVMTQVGLVRKEIRGTASFYTVADSRVDALCELVCGSLCDRLDDGIGQQSSLRAKLAAGLIGHDALPGRQG